MSKLDKLIKGYEKAWDAPNLMDLAKAPRGAKIPFSAPLMNWTTYGGIPRNKITEFHGPEGGGKSTSAVDICKNAYKIFQKEYEAQIADLREKVAKDKKTYEGLLDDLLERGPQQILYIDLEHSFDDEWSKTLGINDDEIKIMTPPDINAETILNSILEMVATGEIGLMVLDSIPSLVPQAQLEKNIGERTVASLAGLLDTFMKKLVPSLTRYGCTFLMINQIRDNLLNPYVVNTPGGHALKFYASLRIYFQIGSPIDYLGNELPQKTENPAGYKINAKIIKQKSAPFNRKLGSYYLMSDTGIRDDLDFIQLAVNKYDIIKKSGGWFSYVDPYTGEILETPEGKTLKTNGLANVIDYVKSNTEYFDKIRKYILADINGNGIEVESNKELDAMEEDHSEVFGDA